MTGIIDQLRRGRKFDNINNQLLKEEVPIYWKCMKILGVIVFVGLTLLGLYVGMRVK